MLDQEECALDVDAEVAVVKGLVDLRDRRELGDAGVRLRFRSDRAAVIALDCVNVDRFSDRHQIGAK